MTTDSAVTDHFVLLDEARRPWLDAEALKHKFLERSAEVHPDRFHQAAELEKAAAHQRYAALNAAYNCLREPRERVRHFLELELGAKPVELQQIPSELMELFLEVSRICRGADAFVAEKAKIRSPLLKVQLFEPGQQWFEELQKLQGQLQARTEQQLEAIRNIDTQWEAIRRDAAARRVALQRLEEIYRLLSYFGRWSKQVQERMVQLSF